MERLRKELLEQGFPVVLGHNDVQELNFLYRYEDRRNVYLIDFDFVGFGYRGVDIGSYFNESGLDNSYPRQPLYVAYPELCIDENGQETFYKSYLEYFWEHYCKEEVSKEDFL